VTINEMPQDTVATESENPDGVLKLIDEFGPGNLPNLSDVRADQEDASNWIMMTVPGSITQRW
jgi:hypothetical protein